MIKKNERNGLAMLVSEGRIELKSNEQVFGATFDGKTPFRAERNDLPSYHTVTSPTVRDLNLIPS